MHVLVNTVNEYELKEVVAHKIRFVEDNVRSGNFSAAYLELIVVIGYIEKYKNALELAKKILEELMLS